MRPRPWGTAATLSLIVAAALLTTAGPSAGAAPRPGLTIGPSSLLPTAGPSLPPLPTPTLPTPTLPTPRVPSPTPVQPTPNQPAPPPAPPGVPKPTTQAGVTPPGGAAALIADDPGASLYPQPPVQPPSTLAGQLAVRLAAVEQRIQYLHNVLTRTSDDLATAQRQLDAVPQLITDLTGPVTAPAQAPPADTPAGRVTALAAAVASGQAELARREAEAASIQQLVAGQLVSASVAPTGLLRPVQGTLTSRFGNRLDPYYHVWQLHPGIDLAAPPGTPIYAAAAGRVTQAGWFGGYGNYTCIAHGTVDGQPGVSTCYGHQSRILVSPGQQVSAGQLIGLVGSTGASTGPHLHFEVRLDGRPVDPLPWLGGTVS